MSIIPQRWFKNNFSIHIVKRGTDLVTVITPLLLQFYYLWTCFQYTCNFWYLKAQKFVLTIFTFQNHTYFKIFYPWYFLKIFLPSLLSTHSFNVIRFCLPVIILKMCFWIIAMASREISQLYLSLIFLFIKSFAAQESILKFSLPWLL